MTTEQRTGARPSWVDDESFPFESRFVELDGHVVHYIAGRCSCGRHADTCKELHSISPELGMLRRWEETQIERLHDQLEHGLPDDHPEVMRLGGSYLRRGQHLA